MLTKGKNVICARTHWPINGIILTLVYDSIYVRTSAIGDGQESSFLSKIMSKGFMNYYVSTQVHVPILVNATRQASKRNSYKLISQDKIFYLRHP